MKNNNLRNLLIRRSILKVGGYSFAFGVGIVVFVEFLRIFLSSIIWSENSQIYYLLIAIQNRLSFIILITFFVGFLVILYLVLRKNYLYFVSILDSVEAIKSENTEMIEIPYSELSDVSYLVNTVKSELQSTARAAKDAEQRKNDLIVYLAHDLKTPLTSVIGYITLLKDERQISEELQERYLGIALDKAERLEDLINEFFEITRFNLTQQVLEVQTVNFTRLLEQVEYEFKPILVEKGLTCNLHVPSNLEVPCDVDKMQRVLDNLLRNAINYSYENTMINMDVEVLQNTIQIVFKNHGHTIPNEKLTRIFEQFYRADTARTSGTGGAGLGLAISKEIIELHGGHIEAISEDEITSFIVTLPLVS